MTTNPAPRLDPINPEQVYPLRAAAALLPSPHGGSLHPGTLAKLARQGTVAGFRRGKYWFFHGAALIAYLHGEKEYHPGGHDERLLALGVDLARDAGRLGSKGGEVT